MNRKQIILRDFFEIMGSKDESFSENYTIWQTDEEEISNLYDKFAESKKNNQKFEDFLIQEKAIDIKSNVIKDRICRFRAKGATNDTEFYLPFRYPIYSFFRNRYETMETEMLEKQKEEVDQLAKSNFNF